MKTLNKENIEMLEQFCTRVENEENGGSNLWSVRIWSSEEMGGGENGFTLAVYDSDTNELIKALMEDPDIIEITKSFTMPTEENFRKMINIVLCYRLRLITRKYGMGHH